MPQTTQRRPRRSEDPLPVRHACQAHPVWRRNERCEGGRIDGCRVQRDPIRGRRGIDQLPGIAPRSPKPTVVFGDRGHGANVGEMSNRLLEPAGQATRDPGEERLGCNGADRGERRPLGHGSLRGSGRGLHGERERRPDEHPCDGGAYETQPSTHPDTSCAIDDPMETRVRRSTSPCNDQYAPRSAHSRSEPLGVHLAVIDPICKRD